MGSHPLRKAVLALAVAVPCLLNGRAHAQMSLFLATCAAQARHLERLPPAFAKVGMVEVDAAAGPSGPGIASPAPDRRLWSAPGKPGGGDSFAGFTPLGDRPFAVCWVVSRPGLSAADMLTALKRRFPPATGATERGTEAFYGGYERWAARTQGVQVVLGVSWPVQGHPEQGTGFVFLAKPRQ